MIYLQNVMFLFVIKTCLVFLFRVNVYMEAVIIITYNYESCTSEKGFLYNSCVSVPSCTPSFYYQDIVYKNIKAEIF